MMFEKLVRISHERVAVLIGKRGAVKSQIEEKCNVKLDINSTTGEIFITHVETSDDRMYDDNNIDSVCANDTSGDDNGRSRSSNNNYDNEDNLFLPFKAVEIVMAIGRGFAPDVALTLLKNENTLYVISLTEFAGKSRSGIERIKGRVIGERGRARKNMEQLSGTRISVYGKTVSIIGAGAQLMRAVDAVRAISGGSVHGAVYNRLEVANRHQKQQRMILWENDDRYGSN